MLVASSERLETIEKELQRTPHFVGQTAALGVEEKSRKDFAVLVIVVRFIEDHVELVRTSGKLASTLPSVAVRNETPAAGSAILRVQELIADLKITVAIQRIKAGTSQVVVNLERKDGEPLNTGRVTLALAENELASYRARGGKAVFEDVCPGDYTVGLSESGTHIGTIRLTIHPEKES
jgi:hypothetical protein